MFSRTTDALTNRSRTFFHALAGYVAVFHRRHFNMQIDPVQ
jgi:hypothetical protein